MLHHPESGGPDRRRAMVDLLAELISTFGVLLKHGRKLRLSHGTAFPGRTVLSEVFEGLCECSIASFENINETLNERFIWLLAGDLVILEHFAEVGLDPIEEAVYDKTDLVRRIRGVSLEQVWNHVSIAS
jgi:hypothetical protein